MNQLDTARALWPYSERAFEAGRDARELLEPAGIELNEAEEQAAYDYANYLFNGRPDAPGSVACESEHSLETIDQSDVTSSEQTFYIGYFDKPEAQEDLRRLGFEDAQASFEDIVDTLRDVAGMNERLDTKTRKRIAINSLNWHKDALASRLVLDPAKDGDYPDLEGITVQYNPDKLLNKLEDLRAYRRFYKKLRAELKQEPPAPLQEAKRVLLDVHVGRVNNLFVQLYPHALSLAWQLDRSRQTDQAHGWSERLAQTVPVIARAFTHEQRNRIQKLRVFSDDFARRLDLARNGGAWNADEHISPLHPALTQIGAEAVQARHREKPAAQLPGEIIALMDRTHWTADDLAEFFRALLAHDDLLSERTSDWSEVENRDGPAQDGKWQVVVHPRRQSFGVSRQKLVAYVPEKFDRTLTQESPAGVLPLAAHELMHVRQIEYDRFLSHRIPLARLGGRRALTLRELGGIEAEREFQGSLGRTRATNLHYLRAMQVKQQGGNQTQVARAFYDSYLEHSPYHASQAMKDARELAADRILRLYRAGGHNSQPLDYVEQELLLDSLQQLNTQQRRSLFTASSFSIADTLALHRVGLFELPADVGSDPADTVMKVFKEQFLPRLQEKVEASD